MWFIYPVEVNNMKKTTLNNTPRDSSKDFTHLSPKFFGFFQQNLHPKNDQQQANLTNLTNQPSTTTTTSPRSLAALETP